MNGLGWLLAVLAAMSVLWLPVRSWLIRRQQADDLMALADTLQQQPEKSNERSDR